MSNESPLLVPLSELERRNKIKPQRARALRTQINKNYRALQRLADLLNDSVVNVLGERRDYLACYARGRHLFLDLHGVAEGAEFYIAAVRRDCYVMEDVCAQCGTRKQIKLDKQYLDRIGSPVYFRPPNHDLVGKDGYVISRKDAAALLMYERFEYIINALQPRRMRAVN